MEADLATVYEIVLLVVIVVGLVIDIVLVIWALVETVRLRLWRWVVTIVLLQWIAALAWFIAARKQYRAAETSAEPV